MFLWIHAVSPFPPSPRNWISFQGPWSETPLCLCWDAGCIVQDSSLIFRPHPNLTFCGCFKLWGRRGASWTHLYYVSFFFFFQRISCTGDAQLFFPQVTSEQAADNGKDRKLKTKFRIPLFLAGNGSENSYIVQKMCSAEEREPPLGLMESHPSLVSKWALLSAGPHLLFPFTPLVKTYVFFFLTFSFPKIDLPWCYNFKF